MPPRLTSNLLRILAEPFFIPNRFISRVQETLSRRRCEAHSTSRLHAGSRIINNCRNPSKIKIGRHSHIHGDLLVLRHGGQISIGEYSFISEGTRIWSGKQIDIGSRVLISHNVNIHDTNSHSLSASKRHEHYSAIISNGHPHALDDVKEATIVIEDDVWIGFGSAIFKGVTVGRGAVVAAMSSVTKSVAPYTIVGGNPAREIGKSIP